MISIPVKQEVRNFSECETASGAGGLPGMKSCPPQQLVATMKVGVRRQIFRKGPTSRPAHVHQLR